MSEYYISMNLKLNSFSEARQVRDKLIDGYNNHYYEAGQVLKSTLENMFGLEFSEFIFSPFYTVDHFESLIPYLKHENSALQDWYILEATNQDKSHLWIGCRTKEISGFSVFPEKVRLAVDNKSLILEYGCEPEQMKVTPAYIKLAFSKAKIES